MGEWRNKPGGVALGRSPQSRGPQSRDLKKRPNQRAPWRRPGERAWGAVATIADIANALPFASTSFKTPLHSPWPSTVMPESRTPQSPWIPNRDQNISDFFGEIWSCIASETNRPSFLQNQTRKKKTSKPQTQRDYYLSLEPSSWVHGFDSSWHAHKFKNRWKPKAFIWSCIASDTNRPRFLQNQNK
jgi:hypothetical protein